VVSSSTAFIFNREIELLGTAGLKALQLDRLKQLVARLADKHPFYRSHLTQSKIDITKLNSLSDLKHLPFTTKTQLRNDYPFGFFSLPLNEIVRIHASSGTKGKPTIAGYSRADLALWAEVCARSLAAAGVRPSHLIHNSYSYGLFTGGLGLHYGAEKLGATVIPASGGRTQQQILLLKDLGAQVICCTPSYALNIAYTLDELGLDRSSIKLKIGVLGAEPWTEEMRKQIESKLGIDALDIYGLTEIIGPGVSMECAEGKESNLGLHVWEDHFYPEIIDPYSGEVLEEDAEGELVITTLTKEAMPLLRYRTGDLSRLSRQPCKCGRTMIRMARVKARLDDMLIIRGVNLYPSEVERVLLNVEELSPHYELVIDRQKALDTLTIQVEVTEDIIRQWGTITDAHMEFGGLTCKIQEILKTACGISVEVILLKPKSLARSEGKAMRVIDKRSKKGE
jgi:phenylacetate-CoA ligase